eukprot:CAMPEP_0116121160 /NCGR_PEP_ID=MMETSP0329-20121206/3552_1 /TAXON_ID=697910 /ORGANISM="Pseudo-nitzschia arenysensis, Strain B593" /LENGTH=684 /DNA_ID=CAMNT_0003614961 /DNA_START=1248 /DNA_END=3303 /DNA_ORIENTATION=-
MWIHLCKQDREKAGTQIVESIKFLEQDIKPLKKLADNSISLLKYGSTKTKQIIKPLLLSSFETANLQEWLIEQDRVNQSRKPLAFTSPFSDKTTNAKHRKNFKEYLEKGLDIPQKVKKTRIQPIRMAFAVAYILERAEFRPARLRNGKVQGIKLPKLPEYRRYHSIDELYCEYRVAPKPGRPLGYKHFRASVNALTLPGTFNTGLSYYYTDFIEMIAFVTTEFAPRASEIADILEANTDLKNLIDRFGRAAELTSKDLRHRLYSRLVGVDFKNRCVSVKFALGDKKECDPFETKEDDPLLLVFSLKPLIYKIRDELEALLNSQEMETTFVSESESKEALRREIESFKGMADVVEKECLHYTKHLFRGWWQETEGHRMKKKLLKKKPGTIFITLDHKSKTLALKKKESMADFFAKNGMSDLGCMLEWESSDGTGTFTWFQDIIMSNVKSQKARDLLPGIEAVLEQLQSIDFLEKYEVTSGQKGPPKEIVLLSDNALKTVSHTPYIASLNSSDRFGSKIRHWVNNEAQRGKTRLDTHFRYVNDQVKKAVKAEGIFMGDPKAFYQCMCYNGGIAHSSVLFLEEDKEAAEALLRLKETTDCPFVVNGEAEAKMPPEGTLAGLIYRQATFVHSRGITSQQLLANTITDLQVKQDYNRSLKEEQEILEIIEITRDILQHSGQAFPPVFEK